MQVTKNSRRQLLKFMHFGKQASRRAMRQSLGYDKYDTYFLLGGTVLGFGLGYLVAYFLRRGIGLSEEDIPRGVAEMSDWGSTTNPLHGDHDI